MKRQPSWGGFVLDLVGGAVAGGALAYLALIQQLTIAGQFQWYESNWFGIMTGGAATGAAAACIYWLMTGRFRHLTGG